MSLETLLEAAEFLEWSKTGKKSSRATRTSKKAEKFKPYKIITKESVKKQKAQYLQKKTAAAAKVVNIATESTSGIAADVEIYAITDPDADQQDGEEEDEEEDDMEKVMLKLEEHKHIGFREIKRSIGIRETHNKLEKNRRAHLKECFEDLRKELPLPDERRSSNLATLRSALRLIDQLSTQQKDLESEKRRMQRLKNTRQAQINMLRKDLQEKGVNYNIEDWLERHKTSTNSTSTASECGEVSLETLNAQAQALTAMIDTHTTHTTTARTSAGEEIQLVIKAVPPHKSELKAVTHQGAKHSAASAEQVTVQAPAQAIHMIQQAAIKAAAAASQQNIHQIRVSSASTVKSEPKVTSPPQAYAVTARPHLQLSAAHSQRSPQNTQVLAVAKLAHGGPGMQPQKILFTQKKPGLVQQTGKPLTAQQLTAVANTSTSAHNNFIVTQVATQTINSAPVTVNLNPTIRVLAPQHSSGQQSATLTFSPQPRGQLIARPAAAADAQPNLHIAPKQLVLITSSDQARFRQHGATVSVAGSMLPQITPMGAVSITAASPGQPKVAYATTATQQLIPITNLNTVTTQAIQSVPVLTGMLPTTGADGTVSYLPVQLTTKPVPTTDPNLSVQKASSMPLHSAATAQLVNGSRGITLVIPPAAGLLSSAGNNVQVVNSANQLTSQTLQIATTRVSR